MDSKRRGPFPFFDQAAKRKKLVKSVKHTHHLCEKLFSLFKKQELSDICVISSDGVKFNAHKIVLSVGSDFFLAMFGGSFKEPTAEEVKVEIVNAETLKPILEYLYTGTIELRNDVVEDILRSAHFFQIKPLIVECNNFMGEALNAKNCVGITLFAEQFDLKQLHEKASQFICLNFEQVSQEEEFLKLNEDQVSKIICCENLYAGTEESVFLALIKWIDYDELNRVKSAFKLFSHVRYWLLSSDFIKKHRNKLPKQVKCAEMICTWLEWHLSPNYSQLKLNEITKTTSTNEKLVFFGKGKKQTYNPELNIWSCETLSVFPSSINKIVQTSTKIIIKTDITLKCFDLETNEISDLPQLDNPRTLFGLTMLKNELYVVGGFKLHGITNWKRLVDKFNFTSNKWQAVAPMSTPLTKPEVATADGLLYVKGNENIIECFHPDTIEWTSIEFPRKHITNFGFTGIKRKLFVLGGGRDNCSACFNSVYIFDLSTGIWDKQSMRLALSSPKCTSWRNRLVVCGGYDDTGTLLNLVQEYNPSTKKWRVLPPVDRISDENYDIVNIQNGNVANN